jgi:hypothetical protein
MRSLASLPGNYNSAVFSLFYKPLALLAALETWDVLVRRLRKLRESLTSDSGKGSFMMEVRRGWIPTLRGFQILQAQDFPGAAATLAAKLRGSPQGCKELLRVLILNLISLSALSIPLLFSDYWDLIE